MGAAAEVAGAGALGVAEETFTLLSPAGGALTAGFVLAELEPIDATCGTLPFSFTPLSFALATAK